MVIFFNEQLLTYFENPVDTCIRRMEYIQEIAQVSICSNN